MSTILPLNTPPPLPPRPSVFSRPFGPPPPLPPRNTSYSSRPTIGRPPLLPPRPIEIMGPVKHESPETPETPETHETPETPKTSQVWIMRMFCGVQTFVFCSCMFLKLLDGCLEKTN